MKKSRVTTSFILIVLFSSFNVAPASYAEASPSPSPSSTLSPTQIYLETKSQFKKDLKTYEASMREYKRKLSRISLNFRLAVAKARKDSMVLGRSATSKATFSASCAAAAKIRDEAVLQLGFAPQPPINPLKSGKLKVAIRAASKSKKN